MLKTEEALQIAARSHGMKKIAEQTGKALGSFMNRCNPKQENHVPTIDDIRSVVRISGNTMPLQAMAYECGGVFIQLPQKELPSNVDLIDRMARLQKNFGETQTEIADAVQSDGISTRHAREVLREGLEDLQDLIGIVGDLYMMAEDREEHPAMVEQWEQLAMESVSS